MAIQNLLATQISRNTWNITWTSTLSNPTYYVYRSGLLQTVTKSTSYTAYTQDGESCNFDVFDSITDLPTVSPTGRVRLTWMGDPHVEQYKIESSSDGTAYGTLAVIPSTPHIEQVYESGFYPNDTICYVRTIPITSGVEGAAREHNMIKIISYPPVISSISMVVDSTGAIITCN